VFSHPQPARSLDLLISGIQRQWWRIERHDVTSSGFIDDPWRDHKWL